MKILLILVQICWKYFWFRLSFSLTFSRKVECLAPGCVLFVGFDASEKINFFILIFFILMTVFWHLKVSSNARKIGRGEIIVIAQNYLCYTLVLVEENINLDKFEVWENICLDKSLTLIAQKLWKNIFWWRTI